MSLVLCSLHSSCKVPRSSRIPVHSPGQTMAQMHGPHFCKPQGRSKRRCCMPNPSRYIRHVFTPLVAHVCDLPEATMIAAVSKNLFPLTMAIQADFGDRILHPPHTGNHTLKLIVGVSQNVDPWDLDKFQKAAKAVNLSGVHMPY